MKLYKKLVAWCYHCPEYERGINEAACWHPDMVEKVGDGRPLRRGGGIPKWCPLPDAHNIANDVTCYKEPKP